MVTFITGPMFSFKSSTLFTRLERHYFAKDRNIVIRPKKDDRDYFSHSVAVETGYNNLAVNAIRISSFDELISRSDVRLDQYDAIFVDESFMIKDCWKIAKEYGAEKFVYFAGLMSSSENELFDEVVKLLPYCDEIVKLNGVCMDCGSQVGNYSFYVGGAKKEAILVGDSEYLCLCQRCRNIRELRANDETKAPSSDPAGKTIASLILGSIDDQDQGVIQV